ncbi:hypothetical protein G6F56_012638 [Rhizopus delemar]|nr:hypothetical protein G6F56_012638 [Rhizopus delemar]
MLVYIGVCSLIGSISVVFTQGFGSAIVHSIAHKDENQFKNWFIYLVLVIVVVTLMVEIVYLNKALNLFNTALVTPTYYVIFTTLTIVSSIVLYRGFDTSAVDIVTCVFGFVCICSGVALLHHSKSSQLEEEKREEDEERVDEEKILLEEPSLLQMFEEKRDQEQQDEQPGAADLFAAPFSGISRYASTTRKSQSLMVKKRQSNSLKHSNTMPLVSSPTEIPASGL